MDSINNNFNALDTSIKQRIGQEEKYIHDIQSGLVKIIRDLHSCHDSVMTQLREVTLTHEKRDELADLIAVTDDRLARMAHVESIQVANTQPQQKTMNPFNSKFWKTPQSIPIGLPVTTTYSAEHYPEINEDHFSDKKTKPHHGIADENIISDDTTPNEQFGFGGSRRRHRRRRRTRR